MFMFSITHISAVLERGRADAAANGGYGVSYQGIFPEAEARPGLWLVGDEGVYVMSSGKLAEGQRPLVVYAEECDPKTDPDYWHYMRADHISSGAIRNTSLFSTAPVLVPPDL
ncbi:DUF3085 domain-containing protein [Agrobacterium tumefaciens]|uniref:DUF3085 domain-containing protein n=1 Tax=Agrobacterium tumefaciens TaxID=358 RepID=UPI001572BBF4|nr:DUF3085 domain-containing protein [Agrobacterium tumefaciens]NTE68282.1 DUF3085 domain-containing protein [Agrobacterium tumefaciens]